MKKFDTEYKVLKVEETTYRNGKPATQVTILCPECEKEEIVTDSFLLFSLRGISPVDRGLPGGEDNGGSL